MEISCRPMSIVSGLYRRPSIMNSTVVVSSVMFGNCEKIIQARRELCLWTYSSMIMPLASRRFSTSDFKYL